ncbi:MAG: hypothetical protein ACLQAT_02555 [Candidatus Binataceae bacterium]
MPAKFNGSTVVLVVASLLIGFAASTFAYRYRWLRVPGGPMLERLDREVHLTPAQRDQIMSIMHDTRFKVMQLQQESRRQRQQVFGQAFAQIRATLTPEQQEKFDRDFAPYGMGRGWHGGDHDNGPPPEPPPVPPPPNGGL